MYHLISKTINECHFIIMQPITHSVSRDASKKRITSKINDGKIVLAEELQTSSLKTRNEKENKLFTAIETLWLPTITLGIYHAVLIYHTNVKFQIYYA